MLRTCQPAFRRAIVVLSAAVLLLMSTAPLAQAHAGHEANCPPIDLADDGTSAFEQVGVTPPASSGDTVNIVSCSDKYVLKVTAAKTMKAGGSYVAFFTVHNHQTGEPVTMDWMKVNQSGAATSGGEQSFLTSKVDGAPGVRAFSVQPLREGEIPTKILTPTNITLGQLTFTVESQGGDANNQGGPGGILPGFEAVALVAGAVAAALILRRRRPPKALAVLLVAALALTPGVAAHAGHSGASQGVFEFSDVQITTNGFSVQTDDHTATFTGEAEGDVQLFDLGDFNTTEGPVAEHTYDQSGRYIVQMVSYDPTSFQGRIYAEPVQIGEAVNNDPPIPVVTAETRWTSFGSAVELDASGTTELNQDRLRYVWAIGRAPVGSSAFNFSIQAVTDGPVYNWTAPSTEGDYKVQVLAIDNRRGFASASVKVRVTETVPAPEEVLVQTNGTLDAPCGAVADTTGQTCEELHDFSLKLPGKVDAVADHWMVQDVRDNADQTASDVNLQLLRDGEVLSEANETAAPETMLHDVGSDGPYQMRAFLETGVDVSYDLEVKVKYDLNPFS